MNRRASRDTLIGFGSTVFALAAMAYDHLLPGDPGGFVVGAAASTLLAVGLFGWLVPRYESRLEAAAIVGLGCSVAAFVPGIALMWLGAPFVLAGAGIALGLRAREGARRRTGAAAVVVGAAFMVLGAAAYAAGGSDVSG